MYMKYVRIKRLGDLEDAIIIFPMEVDHAVMCQCGEIISAGYTRYDEHTHKFNCFGMSGSLQIQSEVEVDSEIMNLQYSDREM